MSTIDTYALISLAYLKQYAGITTSADDDRLIDIINAVSDRIENYCQRKFVSREFTEFLDGSGRAELRLANLPITAIASVAVGTAAAIEISYSGSGYAARVSATSTTLTFVSQAGSGDTTSTAAYSTYQTLATLATQIATVSGWTATVRHSDTTFASDEIIPAAGLNAKSPKTATLYVPDTPEYAFDIDYTNGYLISSQVPVVVGWGDDTDVQTVWPRGRRNIRVVYTAGYSTVPEDVQLAAAELAKQTYSKAQRDPTLSSETIGSYSYSQLAEGSFANPNPVLAALKDKLAMYRRFRL